MQIFPNNAQIGLKKEINEIKNDLNCEKIEQFKEVKTEQNLINFETEKQNQISDGLKLLGELLGYLRREKEMSALMFCRQIKDIEVKENQAILIGDDNLDELLSNEKLNSVLSKFFEKFGLSYKLKEKKVEISDIDILKEMLGSKLVIKNEKSK